jgi:hypothetical protein
MPKHDIWMTFPDKPLKNVDTTIAIWSDGEKLGELALSRGSLDWRSARKKRVKRIAWERLAALLDEV